MSALAEKRRARLPREERIREILHTARDVFCERGYEATAVAEIAARLGVVEGTIYKYFETKRELLNKVLGNWYDELFGDYSRELAGIGGARDRFRYLIWRHLRTLVEYPALCRLIFSEVRSQPDYFASELHGMNKRYTQLLMDVVQDGMRKGEFRRGLPLPLIRDMVYGCIEHHAWSFFHGHGALQAERIADQMTELLCQGMSKRSAEDPLAQRLTALADRMEKTLNRKRGVRT